MGEKGLARRGWLNKVGQKLYALTREGRQMVRRLLGNEEAPPAPVQAPVEIPTAPVKISATHRSAEVAMPWMLQKLPSDLQSPTSLMILACVCVAFLAMLLYALLIRLRVL